MPNDEGDSVVHVPMQQRLSSFVISHSFVIWHSSFVIPRSDADPLSLPFPQFPRPVRPALRPPPGGALSLWRANSAHGAGPFSRLPLKLVPQLPPQPLRVLGPHDHPEPALLEVRPRAPLVLHASEPPQPLEKRLTERRLQPRVILLLRRPLARQAPPSPTALADGAPLPLTLAQLHAATHEIPALHCYRQVRASAAGRRVAGPDIASATSCSVRSLATGPIFSPPRKKRQPQAADNFHTGAFASHW